MSTQVLIRDYLGGCTHEFHFGPDEKARMDARWNREDNLLAMFQNRPQFAKRTRWCDLEQEQFRILIQLHVALLADIPAEKRKDPKNPIIRSLAIVLAAFSYHIELQMFAAISLLTINRVNDDVTTYDLSMSLDQYAIPRPRAIRNGLKIIVDNSR